MRYDLIAVSIIFLIYVGAVNTCGSVRDRLEKLIPDAFEGYRVEDEPMFYVGTSNLTYLYDGGFMVYTDRGVMVAMSQLYTKDSYSSYYSVYLHGMNSEANASSIVNYFKELLSGGSGSPTDVPLGDGGFEYSDGGMNYLYFSLDDLFVTMEGTGSSAMDAMRLSAQDVIKKAVHESLILSIMIIGVTFVFCRNHETSKTPLKNSIFTLK